MPETWGSFSKTWGRQCVPWVPTDGGRVFAPPTVLNFEKSKSIRKNHQIFTNGHFLAPYDPIGKTVTLTFQARSVRTHFRGWLWAQMPISIKMRKTREICIFQLSIRTKNGHETFIDLRSLDDLLGIESCTQKTQFYTVFDRF